jgi:hypothetical protein
MKVLITVDTGVESIMYLQTAGGLVESTVIRSTAAR